MAKSIDDLMARARADVRAEQRKLVRYIRAVNGRVSHLPRVVRRRISWASDLDFQLARLAFYHRIGATDDAAEALRRLKVVLEREPSDALPPVSSVAE